MVDISHDWQGLVKCIRREGVPERVHFIELHLDSEVQQAVCDRFHLLDAGLSAGDPFFDEKRHLAVQRFLGYDYVCCSLEGVQIKSERTAVEDSAGIPRAGGRGFVDQHRGFVTSWEEYDRFAWPDAARATARSLEWYEKNLPDDMCIIGRGDVTHLPSLMGYETLCYALHEQRDLVSAISRRVAGIYEESIRRLVEFGRAKIVWVADDLGFRSGTLISPDDLREFVLPWHRRAARIAHAAGRPYLIHSCGNLRAIMSDLINDVGIDAKHSFEDAIEPVSEAKKAYGDRIALLGGIDMDLLCRAEERQLRRRVRDTLEACMQGGGYCLGSGNSVANYVPLNNYLAMLDEGKRFRS